MIKSTNPADLSADDLTFRADGVGEITLSDGTPLWFPAPVNPRADGGTDDANNYSLDGLRARVVGYNLLKSQLGVCTENNPPPSDPDVEIEIGEIQALGIVGMVDDVLGLLDRERIERTILVGHSKIRIIHTIPEGQGRETTRRLFRSKDTG